MKIRVGFGFDVHQLVPGESIILGGVEIPSNHRALGHSDADVLIHAICDAILGAAGLRDIGNQFPDTDSTLKGIDSKILLRKVMELIRARGYELGNIDSTLVLERPKINPHVEAMRACLADVCGISQDEVSIKATTNETLGFIGREEGLTAYAVVLLEKTA